jgi:hypothetical protein
MMPQAGRQRVRDPIKRMKFFNLPNPSSRTRPWGSISVQQKLSTRSRKMSTLPPSVSRLSRQCGNLDVSQPHRPVTALLCFPYFPHRPNYNIAPLLDGRARTRRDTGSTARCSSGRTRETVIESTAATKRGALSEMCTAEN